jgi:hypothetical protein
MYRVEIRSDPGGELIVTALPTGRGVGRGTGWTVRHRDGRQVYLLDFAEVVERLCGMTIDAPGLADLPAAPST